MSSHTANIGAVAFSPDGLLVATGSEDKTIKIWDFLTGIELRTITGHGAAVWSLEFSADGKTLLSSSGDTWGGSSDPTARLWDVETGDEIRKFEGHTSTVYEARFSPDGQYVLTASDDKTANLYETATGTFVRAFNPSGKAVSSAIFALSGTKVWVADIESTLKRYDVATGDEELAVAGGAWGWCSGLALTRDGTRLIAAGWDGANALIDTVTGDIVVDYDDHGKRRFRRPIVLSDDSAFLATPYEPQAAELWSLTSNELIRSYTGASSNQLFALGLSKSGERIAAGGMSNTVSMWNAQSGASFCTYTGHTGWVWSVDISDDQRLAASGSSDNLAKLWDAETCEEIRSFGPIIDWYITGVDLSPDGKKLLTFSDAKNLFVIFDAETGTELFRVADQKTAYGSFNVDATAVITGGSDGRIAAWNAEDGGLVWEFPTSATAIARPPSISADGKLAAAVGNDWKVYLIDLDTGALLRTFDNKNEVITGAIFSPDGAVVVLTSFDATVKILDTATFDVLAKLGPFNDRTRGAKFSPDGRYLYVSLDEGVVRKYDLNRVLVP